MSNIFNPDNAFFTFMGKAFDVIVLNLIWILMYVPAFGLFYLGMLSVDNGIMPIAYILLILSVMALCVIAPSFIAIYYAMVKAVRRQRSYAFTEFFRSFKLNFKQGTVVSAIFVVIAALLAVDFKYVYDIAKAQEEGIEVGSLLGSNVGLLFGIFVVITYFFIGTFVYLFPVLSRFSMTTKNAVRFSFGLAAKHVWCTVLSVLMWLLVAVLVYITSGFVIFFMVGVATIVESFMMEKVLKRYVLKTLEDQKALNAESAEQGSEGEGTEATEQNEGEEKEESWKDSLEDADAHDDKDEWYLE